MIAIYNAILALTGNDIFPSPIACKGNFNLNNAGECKYNGYWEHFFGTILIVAGAIINAHIFGTIAVIIGTFNTKAYRF